MTQPYANSPGPSPGDGDLKAKAQQVGDQAKAEAELRLSQQKQGAADRLERIAGSVRAAASELERGDDAQLSQYVSSFAGSLGQLADGLRSKNVDELVQDLRGMAQRNPGLFVAGSVAIGFGLARFARASAQRSHAQQSQQDSGRWDSGPDAIGASALDGGSSGGYRGSLSSHGTTAASPANGLGTSLGAGSSTAGSSSASGYGAGAGGLDGSPGSSGSRTSPPTTRGGKPS